MRKLWTRFPRDLTSNRLRVAALGGCLLLGCCLWVPVLTRAATARGPETIASAEATVPSAIQHQQANTSTNDAVEFDQSDYWMNLANALRDDPLFQPADLSQLTRDPFVSAAPRTTSVPVPVLVPAISQTVPEVVDESEASTMPPLELHSTMIGRTRQMAIINGQVCQLGENVLANGRRFRLDTIESHRVVLTAGDKNYELKLARSGAANLLAQPAP